MSCSGQTNFIWSQMTTTIVITDGSVVKPYTCQHKAKDVINVMDPVTLLHKAFL